MSDKSYDTNLASEFYALSALYRPGLDAVLTLGNKKSVDLAVVGAARRSISHLNPGQFRAPSCPSTSFERLVNLRLSNGRPS